MARIHTPVVPLPRVLNVGAVPTVRGAPGEADSPVVVVGKVRFPWTAGGQRFSFGSPFGFCNRHQILRYKRHLSRSNARGIM
jgi:hypothetical protein